MSNTSHYIKACFVAVLSLFIAYVGPLSEAIAGTTAAPATPAAANTNAVTNILCNVVYAFQGATGRGIAVLVVISLAIGLFFAKVTWGLAIVTAVGMGIMFGASTLVTVIAGGSNPCP